jgi:hypothetical protein
LIAAVERSGYHREARGIELVMIEAAEVIGTAARSAMEFERADRLAITEQLNAYATFVFADRVRVTVHPDPPAVDRLRPSYVQTHAFERRHKNRGSRALVYVEGEIGRRFTRP